MIVCAFWNPLLTLSLKLLTTHLPFSLLILNSSFFPSVFFRFGGSFLCRILQNGVWTAYTEYFWALLSGTVLSHYTAHLRDDCVVTSTYLCIYCFPDRGFHPSSMYASEPWCDAATQFSSVSTRKHPILDPLVVHLQPLNSILCPAAVFMSWPNLKTPRVQPVSPQ